VARLETLPQVEIDSRKALRQWLQKHHEKHSAIWLVTFKKPDVRYIPYDEIVEEVLCFGWIDSLPRKLDDKRSMLLLAPRKPRSAWSGLNKQRVGKLMAAGLMRPAGLAAIETAKASGTWNKLDAVENLTIPKDLAACLKGKARENFDAFPRSVKRGILEWIEQAKKPETRQKRIEETVTKAAGNIRANQWRQ
jgi:uncharacterized protein YdeI (YjbR/CyaY-like superfamily)